MLTFCRMTKDKKRCLLFHFNFSPVTYEKHRVGALCQGNTVRFLQSDEKDFGGSGCFPMTTIKASGTPWDYKDYSLVFDVPAYGVVAFEFDYVKPIKSRLRAGTKIVRKSWDVKDTFQRRKIELRNRGEAVAWGATASCYLKKLLFISLFGKNSLCCCGNH